MGSAHLPPERRLDEGFEILSLMLTTPTSTLAFFLPTGDRHPRARWHSPNDPSRCQNHELLTGKPRGEPYHVKRRYVIQRP